MSESGDKHTISAPRGTWGTLLAAPRLISAPSSQLASPSGTVLRPAQLKTGSNPFANVVSDDKVSDVNNANKLLEDNVKKSAADNCLAEKVEKNEESSKEGVPKFLPLHSSADSISFAGGTNVPTAPAQATTTCNFVFGQNLQDRIVKSNDESNGQSGNHTDHPATNGTSELLFSTAVKATTDAQLSFNKDESGTSNPGSTSWSWVSESPAPTIPPPGPIITGEENEDNVLQMNCRLFAFEDGQWKERGRGLLRLNDYENGSRLVCRSAGSLRVLLNTKVWGDMTVDTAGSKSLRVTATDPLQQVKVFLIMARPDEIIRLSKFLHTRVAKAKLKEDLKVECKETNTSTASIPSTSVTSTKSQPSQVNDISSVNTTNPTPATIEHDEAATVKPGGNPVVIVSHEDDDVLHIKRPLETDDENVHSKKICAQQPDDEPL